MGSSEHRKPMTASGFREEAKALLRYKANGRAGMADTALMRARVFGSAGVASPLLSMVRRSSATAVKSPKPSAGNPAGTLK
jgi:hypothetical protein